MRKIFLLLLLTVLLMNGCSSPDEHDTIVIGLDDDFAPIGFRNEKGELVGFDVDLAKEALKRMGVAGEFKPIIWSKKREELVSGNVDIIWNGLDITDERSEYMIFTRPYMDDRQILLTRINDEQDVHSEDDLGGKIVGVQAGSTSEDYLNRNEYLRRTLIGCKVYDKFKDVVDALSRGEIDVIVCDEMVARYETNRNSTQLKIVNVKIGEIMKMAVGFRKDDVALRDRVQKAFDDMIADGTAKEISEKWFNADLIKYSK